MTQRLLLILCFALGVLYLPMLAHAQGGDDAPPTIDIAPAPQATPTALPPPTVLPTDVPPPTAVDLPTLPPTAVPTLPPTSVPADATETEAPAERFFLSVVVDSAFIRSEPLLDAEPSASAFEGDRLEAIGRNADGTWYEVSRPFSNSVLGWISSEVIARPDTAIIALPITSTAGITGPEPVFDTGIAAFVLGNTSLRSEPGLRASRVAVMPASVTVPVLARNADGSSLLVNYNGFVGWVAAFLVRTSTDPLDAPLDESAPPPIFGGEQIPVELQIAQVDRLRDYAEAQFDVAVALNGYWAVVLDGTVVPCDPLPAIEPYAFSNEDVRQLPEIRRIAPRMLEAVAALNASIAEMECGVVPVGDVQGARAAAINARLILENSLFQVNNVEEVVLARR